MKRPQLIPNWFSVGVLLCAFYAGTLVGAILKQGPRAHNEEIQAIHEMYERRLEDACHER